MFIGKQRLHHLGELNNTGGFNRPSGEPPNTRKNHEQKIQQQHETSYSDDSQA